MNVTERSGRPPLTPKEGWLSDGRLVLNFRPLHYSRSSQSLEVTLGELMPAGEQPLLKRRKELTREQAIKLWAQKRKAGWLVCEAQWRPPPEVKPPSRRHITSMGGLEVLSCL